MLTKAIKYFLTVLLTIFVTEKFVSCQEIRPAPKDTVTVENDTTNTISDTTSIIYRHNPARAAFLSAVVPGLGQVYNGKGLFWRLPILYAGIGFEVGFVSYMNNQYQLWHTSYVKYTNYIYHLNGNYNAYNPVVAASYIPGNPVTGLQEGGSSNIPNVISDLKYLNDYYKQYLDLNVIILAGIYFLNIIDATVQAYFFDYNISDDLSLKIGPTLLNNSISNIGTFGLKFSFNLHKYKTE